MHACNIECASVDLNIGVKVMSKLLLIRNIVKIGTLHLSLTTFFTNSISYKWRFKQRNSSIFSVVHLIAFLRSE